ncbi:hypothetical protein D3C72_1789400 [compost metagenome]
MPASSKIADKTKNANDSPEPSGKIWVIKNAMEPAIIEMAVPERLQPRSANRPAKGAEIAPATPASANNAIAVCERWNSGPASKSGEAVQKRQNAPNIKA